MPDKGKMNQLGICDGDAASCVGQITILVLAISWYSLVDPFQLFLFFYLARFLGLIYIIFFFFFLLEFLDFVCIFF